MGGMGLFQVRWAETDWATGFNPTSGFNSPWLAVRFKGKFLPDIVHCTNTDNVHTICINPLKSSVTLKRYRYMSIFFNWQGAPNGIFKRQ